MYASDSEAHPQRLSTMHFTFVGIPDSETFGWFSSGLREVMESEGHRNTDNVDEAKLVLTFFPKGHPGPCGERLMPSSLSRSRSFPGPSIEHISQGYRTLLRASRNLAVGLVPSNDGAVPTPTITPQALHRVGQLTGEYFRQVYARVEPWPRPLGDSTNFSTDLGGVWHR